MEATVAARRASPVDIQAISTGLRLCEDGIWCSLESHAVSYPPDGNECCFAVEDASFWFRHRNNCIVAVVRCLPPPNQGALFDIGGGNGFVSSGLAEAGFEVVLVEPGLRGAANARKRGVRNVICATTEAAKFRPHTLPAVGLFDVIEHIDGDVSFLRSIAALMPPGGRLYATVPAFTWLWSDEDVQAGHFRRYTLNSICSTLRAAGFGVIFASYVFRFLPVPIFLLRALPYKLGWARRKEAAARVSRDHAVQGGPLVRILNRTLKPEVERLKNRHAMRLGSTCLVVAECR